MILFDTCPLLRARKKITFMQASTCTAGRGMEKKNGIQEDPSDQN